MTQLNLTDEQLIEGARYMALRAMREELTSGSPCAECDGSGVCQGCRGEDGDDACEDCRWTGECPGCSGEGRVS